MPGLTFALKIGIIISNKNKIKSLHAIAVAYRPHLVPPPKQEHNFIDIVLRFMELVKSMLWGKLNASTHI